MLGGRVMQELDRYVMFMYILLYLLALMPVLSLYLLSVFSIYRLSW